MKLAILIVAHNNQSTIGHVLQKLAQEKFEKSIFVLDNASVDKTVDIAASFSEISLLESKENLGFSQGNNVLLNRAYALGFSHFLFLNPDAAPLLGSISRLAVVVEESDFDAFTPKLIRAYESLEPVEPRVIDAAGIYFTTNFRHLDRGSGEFDIGQYEQMERVTGGTGAALLVTRNFVEKLSFLSPDSSLELFDERFFAYREDADLALRANKYGLKYLYVPSAMFCHVRKVVPERRSQLSPFLNALSVRNRLLLLINHYSFRLPIIVQALTIFRNILVFGFAILAEPNSRALLFAGLKEFPKHLKRREEIKAKTRIGKLDYAKLFN